MKFLYIILFIITIYIPLSADIYAQQMSNDEYILDLEILPNSITPSPTLKPIKEPNKNTTSRLDFTLESTTIQFGEIHPGEPILRKHSLKVQADRGFQVLVSEDKNLTASDSSKIQDTTCDQGNCSEVTGASWLSPLTFGFGYRCNNLKGEACSPQFEVTSNYRQFPNAELNERAQPLLIYPGKGTNLVEIIYKVNIPPASTSNSFNNNIEYIILPLL